MALRIVVQMLPLVFLEKKILSCPDPVSMLSRFGSKARDALNPKLWGASRTGASMWECQQLKGLSRDRFLHGMD